MKKAHRERTMTKTQMHRRPRPKSARARAGAAGDLKLFGMAGDDDDGRDL